MHRQVLAHLPAIADPPQKLDEHAHPPPDRCHRARRLAQNYFLFSPKRGNFSLHCSVPPQILSNQLQSNGLEQGSASLISESGLIIPSCVHRGSPLVPRRRSKKVVGAKRLWTAAAYRRFGPASLLARKGRSPRPKACIRPARREQAPALQSSPGASSLDRHPPFSPLRRKRLICTPGRLVSG